MAGETHRRRLRALARRCGLAIEPEAFEVAFVHESAVREGLAPISNERLEWLGDPVLGFIAARWLFARYPDASEGELARRKNALVSRETLALTARRLEFGALLQLGAGERAAGGGERTSLLADAFEALVGAVYLSAGLDAAAKLVEREHLECVERPEMALPDPKTELQERVQGRREPTPRYEEDHSGPPHARLFHSRVYVADRCLGEGTGASKKLAQQAAAAAALATMNASG